MIYDTNLYIKNKESLESANVIKVETIIKIKGER